MKILGDIRFFINELGVYVRSSIDSLGMSQDDWTTFYHWDLNLEDLLRYVSENRQSKSLEFERDGTGYVAELSYFEPDKDGFNSRLVVREL